MCKSKRFAQSSNLTTEGSLCISGGKGVSKISGRTGILHPAPWSVASTHLPYATHAPGRVFDPDTRFAQQVSLRWNTVDPVAMQQHWAFILCRVLRMSGRRQAQGLELHGWPAEVYVAIRKQEWR